MERVGCQNYETCGRTGHYLNEEGQPVRCSCLTQEIRQRALGILYCPEPIDKTKISELVDKDLVIDGPLAKVRRHLSRVTIDMELQKKTVLAIDAYRLIEIYLNKDEEFESNRDLTHEDLLVLLLGFGDIKNQRLPDCIMYVLSRRELAFRPTWVILGLPIGQVPFKYNTELAEKLTQMTRVEIR